MFCPFQLYARPHARKLILIVTIKEYGKDISAVLCALLVYLAAYRSLAITSGMLGLTPILFRLLFYCYHKCTFFSLSSLFCLFIAVGLRQVTKYRLRLITMNDNMEKSTHALLAFFNYGVVVAIVFENCGRKMIRKEEILPEERSLYWLA